MKQILILDSNYSTTKLCYKFLSDNYLDENGRIKEDLKFSITIPELNVINSKIPKEENEKIDTCIFLPRGENRKGEGGLRTKGYLKFSYKYKNGKWWAIDFRGNKLFEVNLSEKILKDLEKERIEELPLVTVVTVVLNNKDGLEKTIKSVINQTYPNVEYIVIDGGSTDGTLDVIRRYENYIDYWISESDEGIYDAMNKGILLALGKWINFMNSGDCFVNLNVLYKIFIDIYNEVFNYDIIYGNTVINYGKFERIFKAKNVKEIKKGMVFCHQSSFIKTSLHKKKLYNSLKYKLAADFDFFFTSYLEERFFKKLDTTISKNSIGGESFVKRHQVIREYMSITNNYLYFLPKLVLEGGKGFIWKYIIKIFQNNI